MNNAPKTGWEPIPKTNGNYQAHRSGLIRSLKGDITIMKPRYDKGGYPMINLWVDGKRITRRVHILIMLTFVGPTPNGYQIDHKDNNKKNSRFDNLQFLTPRENVSKEAVRRKKSGLPLGVCYSRTKTNPYRAMIRYNGKKHSLGSYRTIQEAAQAYQTALTQINKGIFKPTIS